ncbi:uncharacterized protein LOC116014503 [Ipomoea triloba]|uniref:uncharacterized protein LOC116014503 n=1 Tax=Ipomoea triloba TaxID=35885 RepID=UPI00125DD7C1|nr:uncharacterized protein LOC116014503 [Ipomoea triloba]
MGNGRKMRTKQVNVGDLGRRRRSSFRRRTMLPGGRIQPLIADLASDCGRFPEIESQGSEQGDFAQKLICKKEIDADQQGSYFEEVISAYYDLSSSDGSQSSAASKNIVSERNMRKKLNERLFALRAIVGRTIAGTLSNCNDYFTPLFNVNLTFI